MPPKNQTKFISTVTGVLTEILTCGGGGYKLEHAETAFRTLEEAIPHVAKLNGVVGAAGDKVRR